MSARVASGLGLLLVTLAWALTLFPEPSYLQHGDWDQYLTFFEIQRRALVDFGELPLWNPSLLGGMPGSAHPQFNTFSPYLLPILLFDVPIGAAVFFALHGLTGLLGTYLLARHLGFARSGAWLAGLTVLFASAPFVLDGVVNRVNGSLTPWLLLLFLKALTRPRWVVGLAFTFALVVLEGGFYTMIGGGLLLGLLALFQGRPSAVARALALCALGSGLGLLLAMIRLLPTLELFQRYPRHTEFYEGARVLVNEAWATLPAAVASLLHAPVPGHRAVLFGQPLFLGLDIGLPLLTLLVLALVYCRRWMLWLLLIVMSSLVLGESSPINTWALLKYLPGLSSLNLSMSLVFVMFVPLTLILADTLQRFVRTFGVSGRARGLLGATLVVLLALVPLLRQSHALLADLPRPPLPEVSLDTPFVQEVGTRMAMLPTVRANHGVVDAYEEVVREPLTAAGVAVRAQGQPGYRGEWYLLESSEPVRCESFRPGHVVLSLPATDADRLVLNQNFFPGWTVERNGDELPVEPHEGLLSVAVSGDAARLVLRYRPRSFRIGMALSAASLLFTLFLLTRPGRLLLDLLAAEDRVGPLLGPTDHSPPGQPAGDPTAAG